MSFAEYKKDAANWITVLDTEFYPDFLDQARILYAPVIDRFEVLATEANDSPDLLRRIASEKQPIRTQLQRVFRKYVSPDTSVEMLKKITTTESIIANFGGRFRNLVEVRSNLKSRQKPDDALIALLNEYKDRGQKGYELTEAFFQWFESTFPTYEITGPIRAGRDIILNEVLDGYEKATPADFLIRDGNGTALVVGFARYDSDRGGAQEDDRTSGNMDKVTHVLAYNKKTNGKLKILFVNDGPGLLLGSMWNDYCEMESYGDSKTMVCTLKMLDDRVTEDWILS